MKKYNIAVIGYGKIGSLIVEKLLLNKYKILIYDKKYLDFENRKSGLIFSRSLNEFLNLLKKNTIIFLCLPNGAQTHGIFKNLLKNISKDSILIDLANSNFYETDKKLRECEKKKIKFLATGISGGIQARKNGFSLMVSGNIEAWEKTSKTLKLLSAKYNKRRSIQFFGEKSQGHYIKMIHNAIEYGYMQLIIEIIYLLNHVYLIPLEQIQRILLKEFSNDSFLINATSKILLKKDRDSGKYQYYTTDFKTQDNGMGRWAISVATEYGVPVPTIAYALMQRFLSQKKGFSYVPKTKGWDAKYEKDIVKNIFYGLQFCFLIIINQGFDLMDISKIIYKTKINHLKVLKVWQRGSILKSKLLDFLIKEKSVRSQEHFFLKNFIKKKKIDLFKKQLMRNPNEACHFGAILSALSYYESLNENGLPTQLLQMQRAYFGGHEIQIK